MKKNRTIASIVLTLSIIGVLYLVVYLNKPLELYFAIVMTYGLCMISIWDEYLFKE